MGEAKHIVLVIRKLMDRSGGAERIYCELANLLCEMGYRVTCLYFDQKDGRPFYGLNHRVERINLYGKSSIWNRRRTAVKRRLSARLKDQAEWDLENSFFIKQLRDYFELVEPNIAISIMPPANTPTLIAAKGTGVKVVACNHNVPAEDYTNAKRWSKNPVDRKLRLAVLDDAAAIHVLFPHFGKWFPAHLHSRIFAIPNYISPNLKRPHPLPAREKTVLAVGRLIEVKNYMQLIRSWASLVPDFPDWKVKIFGVGPQLKEMKDEIDKLNLRGKIELLGDTADLSLEYSKASIFCHPAHYEGFGLSPAEALYMEVPVVFFADCPGVNEFVKDGYNGLGVERGTKGQDFLAEALRLLILDENLRCDLGKNGPASVSSFDLESYRARWIDLIEQVARS